MTGYGSFLIFTAAICMSLFLSPSWSKSDLVTDLNLSVKVAPEAYTFDDQTWFPLVQAVIPPNLSNGNGGHSLSNGHAISRDYK